MELRRIVVGVDFSPQSDLAVRTALRLARRHDAEVVLVHVCNVPEWPALVDPSMREPAARFKQRLDAHIQSDREAFREIHDRYDGQGVEISQLFLDGAPGRGLVDAARRERPGLVVVGDRGRGGVERLLLGSVAERVARHAPVSVLVVRAAGDPADGFQRVVVATDFSDAANRALEMAERIALRGRPIDLINCWRVPGAPGWDGEPQGPTSGADPIAVALHTRVEQAGDAWVADRQGSGAEVAFHLVHRRPARGIRDWIERHDCDLVVLGNRGHESEDETRLGGVASATLRRAPCSVLITR